MHSWFIGSLIFPALNVTIGNRPYAKLVTDETDSLECISDLLSSIELFMQKFPNVQKVSAKKIVRVEIQYLVLSPSGKMIEVLVGPSASMSLFLNRT